MIDVTIARYQAIRIKMIETEQNIDKDMKNMRVKSLRVQAQQNYILNFSRMRKAELVKALYKRINDEILLTLPKVMYDSVMDYLTLEDKINIKAVSKVMEDRTKCSLNDVEKSLLKRPKNYMNNLIEEMINISSISSLTIKRVENINNLICYRFDDYYNRIGEYGSDYKTNFVKVVKKYLNLVESCTRRDIKVRMALLIMKFVSGRGKFLTRHKSFAYTVKDKIEEFENDDTDSFSSQQRRELDFYKEKIVVSKL